MSLSQLIRILWARRLLLLGFVGGAVLLALAANLFMPKKYLGQAAIVVDFTGSDPLKDVALGEGAQTAYVATQADVISSHNVALKVVDREKLADKPDIQEAFKDATDGVGTLRDWIADGLLTKLNVRPPGTSNVLYLEYTSKNPQVAAEFANAFADAYIQTTVDLKVDPAQRNAGWFDQRIQELRKSLEEAQQKLAKYQSEHDVIGVDESKIDVENGRLQELSNQLVTAQSAMFQATAREKQMQDAGNSLPDELTDVAKNPLLQGLKAELARAEAKFADVAQRYDRNHPVYMSAKAERDSLQQKINAEISNVKGTIAKEAALTRQQTSSLQQAVDQQRDRILSLKHMQDDLTVFKRDVESARASYDAALQRASQSQLESRIDHTNVAVLSYAPVPTTPTSPKQVLNLALAVILGVMLGVGVILSREMGDPHIHSRIDLLTGVELPVLAELPPDDPASGRPRGPARLTKFKGGGSGRPQPPGSFNPEAA